MKFSNTVKCIPESTAEQVSMDIKETQAQRYEFMVNVDYFHTKATRNKSPSWILNMNRESSHQKIKLKICFKLAPIVETLLKM